MLRDFCDLGENINLIPFLVLIKLVLGEVKSIMVSLQLADKSMKYPREIIKDVWVTMDKFFFLLILLC